jgi:hypothetical protein
MFWRDPSIVKGTSSIWSVMFSVLSILAFVWIIAFNVQDPTWRWSIAAIGTIVALGSPGGLSWIYWLCSPRFRRQHRAYRRGGPPPGGPDALEPIRIPRKQFQAWTGGAMDALRELREIVMDPKARVREPDKPIVQDDVTELIRKLVETQREINSKMELEIANSKDTENTEWDQTGYATFVAPTIQMANSPQAIVDLAVAAVNKGARSAELVYNLMIAEMDAAVARYYVTMNAGLQTTGAMSTALLGTAGVTPDAAC